MICPENRFPLFGIMPPNADNKKRPWGAGVFWSQTWGLLSNHKATSGGGEESLVNS